MSLPAPTSHPSRRAADLGGAAVSAPLGARLALPTVEALALARRQACTVEAAPGRARRAAVSAEVRGKHAHVPLLQAPRPEHPRRHSRVAQFFLDQPSSQRQRPSTHAPRPVQPSAAADSQPSPIHPSSQSKRTSVPGLPDASGRSRTRHGRGTAPRPPHAYTRAQSSRRRTGWARWWLGPGRGARRRTAEAAVRASSPPPQPE